MTLRTRRPTGLSPWPMILVDGFPKTGKTGLLCEFSASEFVGDTFIFQIGERAADEYRDLGPFHIVDDLDGTWADFYDQVVQATLMPRSDPDRPNVIAVDSGTECWSGLRDWVDTRARNSEAARALLTRDPDATVVRGQNLWNDANDRWVHLLKLLATWDGIAVLTARGDEVTAYENGQPAPNNRREYRADIQKDTTSRCTAVVSLRDYRQPRLTALTKLGFEMPDKGYLELPRDATLEHLVFDIMDLSVENRQASRIVGTGASGGYLSGATKKHLIKNFADRGYSEADARAAAIEVWHLHYPPDTEVDSVPQTVWDRMLADIERITAAPPTPEAPAQAPDPAPAPTPAPEADEAPAEAATAPSKPSAPPATDAKAEARQFAVKHGGDPDQGDAFTYDADDDTTDDVPEDDEGDSAESGS